MSLIQVFWGALWFSNLPLPTLQPRIFSSARAWRGLAVLCRHMDRVGMWGKCFTSTFQGTAKTGGIPEGAQCNAQGSWAVQLPQVLPGWVESPSLGCLQWPSPGGRTMEEATPASGSLSLQQEALLQPKQ